MGLNIFCLFVVTSFSFQTVAIATPNFWKCTGLVGGQWGAFGDLPNACNVTDFGDPKFVQKYYSSIIYETSQAADEQLPKYITNMYAGLRDAASYYLTVRQPQATATEIEEWTHLVMTTAMQESMWSQYRLATDKKIKMMRGDSGHGHGMMQLDDRDPAHVTQLTKNGAGWNLAQNLASGLDELYYDWNLASHSSCVKTSVQHAQGAYSAYNGGPGSVCRWSSSKSTFSRFDKDFLIQYRNQLWLQHVSDTSAPAKFDISCLMESKSDCAVIP